MKTVELTIENHIAVIALNRPEQSNSIILDTFGDLEAAARQVATDDAVRVVILTGHGKHFCAGLDMSLFPKGEGELTWFEDKAFFGLDKLGANAFQRAATIWRELDVPVIAAVNGVAFGGGCQIALGADIRIGEAATKMSLLETHWGLIPDMGLTVTLPAILPMDVAAELILSAKIMDATQSREAGLLTSIAENSRDAAMALAENIAAKSPDAIKAAKKLYRKAWTKEAADLLKYEALLQRDLLGSASQVEAVSANLGKREPVFK